jgi:hypothetical protein
MGRQFDFRAFVKVLSRLFRTALNKNVVAMLDLLAMKVSKVLGEVSVVLQDVASLVFGPPEKRLLVLGCPTRRRELDDLNVVESNAAAFSFADAALLGIRSL